DAAYRYLAHIKKPEDRPAIEALLESPLQESYSYNFGPLPEAWVKLMSDDRALGDELLGHWDGNTNTVDEEDSEWLSGVMIGRPHKLCRFSALSGKLRLPFGAPPNTGPVSIYLIPSTVAPGQWSKDQSVLKLTYKEPKTSPFPGRPAPPWATLN